MRSAIMARLEKLEQQHTDNEPIEPTRILWEHVPADLEEADRLKRLGRPFLIIKVKDARNPPEVTA